MNSKNSLSENIFEESSSNHNYSNLTAAISCVDDIISIHTNIFDIKSKEFEQNGVVPGDPINKITQSIIIDLPKLTQKLNPQMVKLLCIQTLDKNIEITEKEICSLNHNDDSSSSSFEYDTFLDDVTYGLGSRRKYEKLTNDQIKYLRSLLFDNNIKVKEISVAYNVSPVTLNKIKREYSNEDSIIKQKKILKVYGNNKVKLLKAISNFILTSVNTLTVQEITSHWNNILNENYSTNLVRNFMANFTDFTFKRVKSRPCSINLEKVQNCRKLFAIKFAQEITTKSLIINIDESCINKSIKTSYSWGIKGAAIECKNAPFLGSISWIMGICSNGAWVSFLIKETINSRNFVWFLKIMKDWLNSHDNFGYDDVVILLDNASIHKSKEAKIMIERLWCKVIYLPAYSPEFAPIEMAFSLLKRDLSKSWQNERVNLNEKECLIKIRNSLRKIKSQTVKNLFWRFYKNIKKSINI